jgi:hypothetical protein
MQSIRGTEKENNLGRIVTIRKAVNMEKVARKKGK